MIQTKQDLKYYLLEDQKANHLNGDKIQRHFGFHACTLKYTYRLRHVEYHLNRYETKRGLFKVFSFFFYKWNKLRLNHLSLKLGIFITPNAFGPGLRIAHPFSIYVGKNVKGGKNCFIHQNVTIGLNENEDAFPTLGDNVVIGAGAKIIGGVRIANNVCIGANAVVVSNIDDPNSTWAGVPAKKISNHSSLSYLSPLLNVIENKQKGI